MRRSLRYAGLSLLAGVIVLLVWGMLIESRLIDYVYEMSRAITSHNEKTLFQN